MLVVKRIIIVLVIIIAVGMVIFQYSLLSSKEQRIKDLAIENLELKKQLSKLESQNSDIEPIEKPQGLEQPEEVFFDTTKYENRDLGIRFLYDKSWGKMNYLKTQGQSGNIINLAFEKFPLIIAATTKDFYVGEINSILNVHGLETQADQVFCLYRYISNDGQEQTQCLIENALAADKVNVKNQDIYLFDYESLYLTNEPQRPLLIQENDWAAIAINVSQQQNQYPAIIFYLQNPSEQQLTDFKEFLDTLYYIKS